MIEVQGLTKRYGDTVAVAELSFSVPPGRVTGFLGPNGAGKSTTLRVLLGLDRADSGTALVDGVRYVDLPRPLHTVGALLDARAVAPRRSARSHVLALARSNRIPDRRVDEVLELCGLAGVAGRPTGTFSLGMGQRLDIAAALLGDPEVLVLDEPINGLDADGIIWIRELLRGFAEEGRTVFLSSHLMSEVALTATDLVIVGEGRLIAETTVEDVIAGAENTGVLVRSPQVGPLERLLQARGYDVRPHPVVEALLVRDTGTDEIGLIAAEHDIALTELSPQRVSLEEAYLELTSQAQTYRGRRPDPDGPHRESRPPVVSADGRSRRGDAA